MVAVLAKIFGTENFEMAEDVVQDALISAMETWKYKGLPDNPTAWLYRTAKNKAIDLIRRKKHSRTIDFTDPERQLLTSEYTMGTTMNNYWQEAEIKDDFLGMMFACCHPEISTENQITFILKSLCGFSTKEVAKAFLSPEDTISKRLYRTKEFFRKHKIKPHIPSSKDLNSKMSAVLSAIYLIFNEGYNSTHNETLIREDLISQSMMLCKSLLEHEKTRLPECYALMALICFHAARTDSRLSPEGELILLEHQDRSLWNKELIQYGQAYLRKASSGQVISIFHLEAAISYEHCVAKTYQDTNWRNILGYYDAILTQNNDPIVALNRCSVVLRIEGPAAALEAIGEIKNDQVLDKYYLYHATIGTIYQEMGMNAQAIDAFQKALSLTQSKAEKKHLVRKIERLSGE